MFDCNCLIHPFQNDPGTSQRQRVNSSLLSESVKIDGRELADLLDYFVQLSRHINYYDTQMNIGDWQPFFKKSTPFVLSSVIRYPVRQLKSNFHIYTSLFKKRPAANGLQLLSRFIYHHFIERVNNWHQLLKETHLPVAASLDQLIRDRLQQPVRDFIGFANAANNDFNIRPFNFHALFENKVWNIDLPDLYVVDQSYRKGSQDTEVLMSNLYDQFAGLFPLFVENLQGLSKVAETSLPLSLVHTKEEYQEKHPPHLGLLFAFLTVFKELQNDLNQFTRKHLDFFYKDILNFKAAPATGDQAHILIEIQQQLKKYILNKGTLVKAGKDEKKQEMLFGMDDEIAATKTTIAATKTLYLNNKQSYAETYVEGVYMAPNSQKADGIALDFSGDIKNFPTLGSKSSKYSDPETMLVKPHPNARIGFILGSPILYMQGGQRKVSINLACRLKESICEELANDIITASDCCNEGKTVKPKKNPYPEFYHSSKFYELVNEVLANTYYYLSQDLLKEALKKGVSKVFIEALRKEFKLSEELAKVCYCPVEKKVYDNFLKKVSQSAPLTKEELSILDGLVLPVKALNVHFSGADKWIEPGVVQITMTPTPLAGGVHFILNIDATLSPDQEPITYYDKEKLGEDYNTSYPLVKIELDDRIKLETKLKDLTTLTPVSEACCVQSGECCVLIPETNEDKRVSLYHFFRNVILEESTYKTGITVEVCGLKHLVVQNDESLLDVNAPMVAFGTQPKIGSSFYIGSKELFSKNWQEFWVNVEWKDRPANFSTHYEHYNYVPFEDGTTVINTAKFKFVGSILNNRAWKALAARRLFKAPGSTTAPFCNHGPLSFNQDVYHFKRSDFAIPSYDPDLFNINPLKPLNIDSSDGFLRMSLATIGFQHDRYAFVIARHMIALANLVDPLSIKKAIDNLLLAESLANSIQARVNQIIPRINNIQTRIAEVIDDLTHNEGNVLLDGIDVLIAGVNTKIADALGDLANVGVHLAVAVALIIQIESRLGIPGQNGTLIEDTAQIKTLIDEIDFRVTNNPDNNINTANLNTGGIEELINVLRLRIADMKNALKVNQALKGGLPKEPYTPLIKVLSIDYTAKADNRDIELIHLYPFQGSYKYEEITQKPGLFPRYCDEGTLFIGLNEFVPGDNLNLLFQLAEATGDSESEKETVNWHYLDSNIWKPLRAGFEVVDDATQNLTTSGIVKFAMPLNMTNENSVMPAGLYWIKASIPKNSKAVSETTGIHPQAVKVAFEPDPLNDTARLDKALDKGSISKLNTADPSISGVDQPYESFGGRLPEGDGHFYTRVSEILRHKGRAIQPWDYERLVLEEFPELFKAKCITHSFALNAHVYKNDFPYAPGYVMLAVIPDLNKLKAGYSFEPKVPVSILEKIEAYFKKRTSPFVRFRAMNPRYEKVQFCIRVQLYKGKDENYYKEKLKQDLREFLAPWAIGKYDKLTFGECVYRSGIIQFLERTDYVDFVTDLKMWKENGSGNKEASSICPDTARSILIAGSIEVCIEEIKCEKAGPYTGCKDEVIDKCNNPSILVMEYCK